MKAFISCLALSVTFVSMVGCASAPPHRVSSLDHMPPGESEISLKKPKGDTIDMLKALMAERGLKVKAVAASKQMPAEYFIFSGPRQVIGTSSTVATVGSWISAKVEGDNKSTKIKFLGKPNIGGQEMWSDADAELADAEYWCRDTNVDRKSEYFAQLSGREEAQLIRGLIVEIKAKSVG